MLAERLEAVRSGVADAAAAAGRSAAEITLIAVTKFQPATLVRELFELGIRDFGESRHQEARAKAAELAELPLTWHFVGQLQTKKARQVSSYASVIHSVDRVALVDALADATQRLDCFVQLNLTADPGRGGVATADLEPLVERVVAAPGLRLLGVMAVAPLGADPRRSFAAVRAASERVVAIDPAAAWISAGMSGDYREAILEGATHLRIGTAITGNRPAAG
ncbi:YggS family pyridoxal phosphate-dependent enzyme [Parafrigoribacterium mesophilum]|uniref:YggS family pyridoxal phosphate-dependent enzyme n=1 Tax=Parafrigoribacterium mesophilum TaxID=433646 RepID=UPI0031FC0017